MDHTRDSKFRTVRGYQILSQESGALTPAMEDYLEMIYRLHLQSKYARVGKLAELLQVRPPSASRMVAKLSSLGYLVNDRYEIILLSPKGLEAGAALLDRHNTVLNFLKHLGCLDPLAETELIEHAISPHTIGQLKILLAHVQGDASLQQKLIPRPK